MRFTSTRSLMEISCVAGLVLLSWLPLNSQDLNADGIVEKYHRAKEDFEKFEQVHGGFIETKNTRMHYLTWGNPEDLPLIWIHGSFTNAYEIKDVADEIVKHGYYLIAIDFYGHGLTPLPDREVSLYHVADDILEMMDDKKIEKAVIGGFSRGGYMATAFYDAYPDHVLGLVLEDGGSVAINTFYHNLEESQIPKIINEIFDDRVAYLTLETEFEVYKEYHDHKSNESQFELLAWITQDNEGLWTIGPGLEQLFNIETPEQFMDNIFRPTQSPLFARSMALMDPFVIYRDLKVPMIILDPTHENDLFPFEKDNEKLKNMHPELIDHVIYEDTGHNIHYERPEKFVADVIGFLHRIKSESK